MKQEHEEKETVTASVRQFIRLKNGTRIFEEADELVFVRSYGKAVSVQNSPIVLRLIEKMQQCGEKTAIIRELAEEFVLDEEWTRKLTEELIGAGVMETYTPAITALDLYTRYETQLSFLDLLQPVRSIEEKMDWQLSLGRLHIVIVGVGGIGNYVALSLAAMGIGKLTIIDGDTIELSNLNRQVIFNEKDRGEKKAQRVVEKISALQGSCETNYVDGMIATKEETGSYILRHGIPDFVFICSDQPVGLPVWINEIASQHYFPFIKCSYQGTTGFIGPIIKPGGKLFQELVEIIDDSGDNSIISQHNKMIKHASSSPSNAIFANLAVLESIKYLLKIPGVNILERRLFFDLEKITLYYDDQEEI